MKFYAYREIASCFLKYWFKLMKQLAILEINVPMNIFNNSTGGHTTKDVREFCATCNTCQQLKPSNKSPARKHHLLPILTKPWNSIRMDFIGPFPESKGFNYLWVVICHMTSMVHLIPIHTTTTATQLSWIY